MQAKESSTVIMADDLAIWLAQHAGVGPKFMDAVMATCEEQMISSVANLTVLQKEDMLGSIFKPTIAACIKEALCGGSRVVSRQSSEAGCVASRGGDQADPSMAGA